MLQFVLRTRSKRLGRWLTRLTTGKASRGGRSAGKTTAPRAVRRALILSALFVFAGLCFGCAAGAASSGTLVISEVMSSNNYTLTDETYGTPDWIELYNGTDREIDLEGYSLTNNAKKLRKYTFPSVVLKAGEYLLVYACSADEKESGDVFAAGFNISKEGECLILADAYAGLVQQLEVPELVGDVSYARSASGAYGFSAAPTPGGANVDADIRASLSALMGTSGGSLRLNEILPYPTEGYAWAELVNDSETAVQLGEYYISDRASEPLLHRLPTYTLDPGAYVLVFFTGGNEAEADGLAVDFCIGTNDDSVTLTGASGKRINALGWAANAPEGVSVAYGAKSGNYTVPTPLAANAAAEWEIEEICSMGSDDPVILNEVMPLNDERFPNAEGDCLEWVELYNRSDEPVSLAGYYLSDDPDAPFRFALPDAELGAGEYRIVCLCGNQDAKNEAYADFGLSAGESVVLTAIDGMRQDVIAYDGACPKNASFGRSASGEIVYYGVPTPGYENAKAYSSVRTIGWFDSSGVFISEVLAAEDSEQGDWIELGNGSGEPISLDGWYLSDDPAQPLKYRITNVTIPAGGYAALQTDAAEESGAENGAFGISATGEWILLSEPSGRMRDLFASGYQRSGVTSGRIASDETVGRVFYVKATKAKKNAAEDYGGYAAAPYFSDTSLYHDTPFSVTLHCAAADADIYYTTDGSLPNERSIRYTGPIMVSKNTAIRAITVSEGLLVSNEASATYLLTEPHTVPVVCVAADPAELEEIFLTTDRYYKSEYRADFAFYDEDGALCASFFAGMRAKGRSMLSYTQKSFSVSLRERYGQSSVSFPFFEDSDIVTYSAFSLRSGGQDRGRSRLRDSYFSRLAEGLHIENFNTRVVALYLNGTYYGVFDLNEEQDESYLAAHYGADGSGVDIVNRNDEVKAGGAEEFLRVRAFARTQDLSNDRVFAQFAEWVDVDYFTDYLVFRSYIADSDLINQTYWRSQDYAIKWRPLLFDTDYGLYGNEYQQEYKKDILARYFYENGVSSADGTKTNMDLFVGLKQNAAWRRAFVKRYLELMSTTLSPEHMLALLDEMDDVYLAEMPRQIAAIAFPPSIAYTEQWLEQLRTGIRERPAYALQYLKENFPDDAAYIDALAAYYKLEIQPDA